MPSLTDRIKNGWNAFKNKDPSYPDLTKMGISTSYKPDRMRLRPANERSIVNVIYNRMAMDVAAVDLRHVRLDQDKNYADDIYDELNDVLTVSANIDQTGRAFIQDVAMSMFDEGVVAVVITDATDNPKLTESYNILSLRTGKVLEWYPENVKVRLYNERTGQKEDKIFPKHCTAIIENPFYYVMNEPNSVAKRLMRKLALLDITDENASSGKLDMIIQLPYVIKTETRKNQAEARRKDLEMQLAGSKYGVAYIDGTEKVTQLNRSIENHLFEQTQSLTEELFAQLGLTKEILNGTANEETMINYYNRAITPVLSAIAEEFERKFLSKTARTQGQAIMFFRDPFKLAPISTIADVGDKFKRNEIMSTNELRSKLGMKPRPEEQADAVVNPNMPVDQTLAGQLPEEQPEEEDEDDSFVNEQLANLDANDAALDELERSLNE